MMVGIEGKPSALAAAALGTAILFGSDAGIGQTWAPERPVEIVVNTAAGSGPDRIARTLQKIWQERKILDAATVSNRPGGGGAIAYGYLNQKTGDGHVLAIASASLLTNHIMGRSPVGHAELTAIARLYGEYIAVAVRPDSPLKSGRELVELLRKDPSSLSFGIATSLGNSNHQAVALAAKASGIDVRKMKTVVFQSGGNAITALLGGHVDVVPASVSSWVGRLKEGQVRIIAVAAPARLPGVFAEVPTWQEQGVKTVVSNWRSVVGPRGLTSAQVGYWVEALRKLSGTPEWKADLERQLLADEFLPGPEFRKQMDEEYAELKSLLSELELVK
jgi:putative tricarboxylic transport membrane protein